MYFTWITPKRGSSYGGPSREMCQGWKRKRDACAAAEEQSQDDSVLSVVVYEQEDGKMLSTYVNGKIVK